MQSLWSCTVARQIMASHGVEPRAGAPSQAPGRPKRLEEKDEQEGSQQLLPGIPNEISVDLIAAKFFSWKDICIMSSVSRGWCEAVRSRQVYNARVRAQSTEPLIGIIPDAALDVQQMFIDSMNCNSFYQLPAISGLRGLPLECKLVSLDGRIFMMGGLSSSGDLSYSDEVYVLDVAGHKQWKPCAKMKQARGQFGCGVLDGRIYVFGGRQCKSSFELVRGSEMYDPKENIWRTVKASPNLRFDHSVFPIGSELVMKRGTVLCFSRGRPWEWREGFLEAYHPGKDEWRVPSNSENWVQKFSRLKDSPEFGTDGTAIISRSPPRSPYLSV